MILTFTVTGALAVPVADGLVTVPALNLMETQWIPGESMSCVNH